MVVYILPMFPLSCLLTDFFGILNSGQQFFFGYFLVNIFSRSIVFFVTVFVSFDEYEFLILR